MGIQSSRIWLSSKDHKEIYLNGKYHDKMYIGSTLVWQKQDGETKVDFQWMNGMIKHPTTGVIYVLHSCSADGLTYNILSSGTYASKIITLNKAAVFTKGYSNILFSWDTTKVVCTKRDVSGDIVGVYDISTGQATEFEFESGYAFQCISPEGIITRKEYYIRVYDYEGNYESYRMERPVNMRKKPRIYVAWIDIDAYNDYLYGTIKTNEDGSLTFIVSLRTTYIDSAGREMLGSNREIHLVYAENCAAFANGESYIFPTPVLMIANVPDEITSFSDYDSSYEYQFIDYELTKDGRKILPTAFPNSRFALCKYTLARTKDSVTQWTPHQYYGYFELNTDNDITRLKDYLETYDENPSFTVAVPQLYMRATDYYTATLGASLTPRERFAEGGQNPYGQVFSAFSYKENRTDDFTYIFDFNFGSTRINPVFPDNDFHFPNAAVYYGKNVLIGTNHKGDDGYGTFFTFNLDGTNELKNVKLVYNG